jgi:hypothetical protein
MPPTSQAHARQHGCAGSRRCGGFPDALVAWPPPVLGWFGIEGSGLAPARRNTHCAMPPEPLTSGLSERPLAGQRRR